MDKNGCGPNLLQVIINKAMVQNHSTVMELCTQIMHLPTYMTDMHFNIKVFNEHAKDLCQQIGQYQEDVSETLLMLLFAAYDLIPDQEFQYIIHQK